MYDLRVKDLMTTEVITLARDERLDMAEEVMKLARIRHLPVVDNLRLVGLVTHRDLMRAQVSALADISEDEARTIEGMIPVSAIMNSSVRTVTPDTSALAAAKLIRDNKYGCLPVVEEGNLVGIITEADFLELVIRAFEGQAEQEDDRQEAEVC